MGFDKFEIWVHDHILKNDKIRHFCYGAYQRALYMTSPKIKFEGDIKIVTPQDGYEYLFGYYDKCPWSDDGKYMLALRVKNASYEADSVAPADIVRICLGDNNRIEKLTTTHCWNVQQGCMAQWIDNDTILYNDFRDGKYCSVILNISDKSERLLSVPVYTLSMDKRTALTLDFSRLHRLRPGYGYANVPEETAEDLCPNCPCIMKVDLASGKVTNVLKYTDLAAFEPRAEMENAEHKVNHLMLSPDGTRFMVLHRWFKHNVKYTRLLTCDIDGTNLYNLSDDDFVSHCCWKNNTEILSYLNKKDGGKGYYLMKDKTNEFKRLWSQLAMDGHPTYSYDGEFVVTDTYPDRRRMQSLYVMNKSKIFRIARVFSPFKYGGATRCDLHPRWSKDGTQICFDASFEGKRSVCVANVSENICKKNGLVAPLANIKNDVPQVSIIMPCYNVEKFLDETFEMLESQTYQDFEVICINDGSKDNTLGKLRFWQAKGTLNIQIIDKENGGVSKARNDGLKAAKGEYIVFLDSDDAYHERYIEKLFGALRESGADIAYCRLDRKYENVMSSDNISCYPQTQKEAMDNLLYRMGEFGFCCYIYKSELLKKLELEFDTETKFGEDREFNWKYLCHCKNACFVDAPLYWYRVNVQSATGSKASWRKTDLLYAVKRVEQYLEENNCEYSTEFSSYMYARAMWAVAKTFAVSHDKDLYDRLCKDFDVKTCMKRTSKDKNKMVSLASRMFMLNPQLFYSIVGLKG